MRALTYHGTRDVRVETVPDPVLRDAQDIVLRVTATAICGSDLHLYRGKVPGLQEGDILGHEFMGVVEDVGAAVTRVKRGDRVVVPFVIACGACYFCERSLFAACETTNDGRGAILNKKDLRPSAALFSYTHLYGGVPGRTGRVRARAHGQHGPAAHPRCARRCPGAVPVGHPAHGLPGGAERADRARQQHSEPGRSV